MSSVLRQPRMSVRVTMLGGGSNVLVADGGIRGIVVRPRAGHIERVDATHVRADAAVTINGLVRWLVGHGLAGLEAWAVRQAPSAADLRQRALERAPDSASSMRNRLDWRGQRGSVVDVPPARWDSATIGAGCRPARRCCCRRYSSSTRATPDALRATARASLAYRKRTQPLASPSAGCIFQNPAPAVIGCPRAFRGRPARWSTAPGSRM